MVEGRLEPLAYRSGGQIGESLTEGALALLGMTILAIFEHPHAV